MIVRVKIAEAAVRRKSGLMVAVGLGSCVGVALYDRVSKVGGMAHIFLSDSTQFNGRPQNLMKFADTALPLLIDKMLREGAAKNKIIAKIAGGSELFNHNVSGGTSENSIGQKNILAVKKVLQAEGIAIIGEDVGGNFGRTMKLYVDSGIVEVTSLKGYKKVI